MRRTRDDSVFATLRRARRVWAVAAVHGEVERLRKVHERLGPRLTRGDRLVYLGNALGHGPAVAETVGELVRFRAAVLARPHANVCDIAYVRGAQEEMWSKLLQLQIAPNPAQVLEWMLEQGIAATLAAYGSNPAAALSAARGGALSLARWTGDLLKAMQQHPGHVEFMSALRRAAFTADGSLLFVHAGIDPTLPLTTQRDALWWGGGDFDAIDKPFFECKRVVRGFSRGDKGVRFGRFTATIDDGCGFGGPLVAICFDLQGTLADRIEA